MEERLPAAESCMAPAEAGWIQTQDAHKHGNSLIHRELHAQHSVPRLFCSASLAGLQPAQPAGSQPGSCCTKLPCLGCQLLEHLHGSVGIAAQGYRAREGSPQWQHSGQSCHCHRAPACSEPPASGRPPMPHPPATCHGGCHTSRRRCRLKRCSCGAACKSAKQARARAQKALPLLPAAFLRELGTLPAWPALVLVLLSPLPTQTPEAMAVLVLAVLLAHIDVG